MVKPTLLVGAMLALVMCLAATTASAQRSLACETVWKGPSSNNSLLECLGNTDRIRSQWPYYLYPGFAALVFIFTVIGLPIVFCCHCCRYGKAYERPNAEAELGVARCCLWMWIVISVLVACGVCVLVVYGSVLLEQAAKQIVHDTEHRTLDYFNNTRANITMLLTNYSADPPIPPSIDFSAFDAVNETITHYVHLARDNYLKYFRTAEVVACCVGSIGVFLMLCMLIFALCRCSGCCPIAWSCLYFVFALAFALLAVLFTICIYVLSAGCGEVGLQYSRAPGVFQWYLVPWCEKEFNFQALQAQVQTQEQQVSQSACAQLLNYCDNDPVYSLEKKDHIFMCGNGITDKSQCNSLDDVVDVVIDTYVKPMLTNTLCVNQTGMEFLEKCTVQSCASRCVDYDALDVYAKTYSIQILQASDFAVNASTALSYVWPLLDCNFIIDKGTNTIETRNYNVSFTTQSDYVRSCSAVRTSSVMLGTGFFVGALMFILGIYAIHRGASIQVPSEKDEDFTVTGKWRK
ncbi:conserved hypothetical protein [Leishmania mexicana MHOM/GT/2001/U1103]|uniref:Uncharacterized protein n=1 Tax=Leishmania mexicana (strain MHOM/GT/2001/U1103) TaxID=929439 RepID=E9AS08_LEIMU|nr:conserved hypothetical protein [Leishmania mexicana MHOM/GT/2001/U1103]CBZ25729.1 conserved hypothetical protein [Leishmania mexicana MHOM/GT/2001/U1103]